MAVMISKRARIVEALILVFFLAGVILGTYMMPVISNGIELNREAVVMSLNTTSWIHTYGII